MDLGLAGKVAIVTGGSQGMGKAFALALAQEGVRVAICARTLDILEKTAREIEQKTNTEVLPVQADVTIKSDIEKLVAATVAKFERVDILVNNADTAKPPSDFFAITDEDWLDKFSVKVLAPIRLTKEVVPYMKDNGWGRIINIGGISSRAMRDGGWTKGVAQAGLINLTKKLSDLLGRYGITANVVEPGGVWTDGKVYGGRSRAEVRTAELQQAAEQEGVSYEEMEKRSLSKLIIGRRIEAEDTAYIILFLASERSATITGEVVLADGGNTRAVRF